MTKNMCCPLVIQKANDEIRFAICLSYKKLMMTYVLPFVFIQKAYDNICFATCLSYKKLMMTYVLPFVYHTQS